MIFRGPGPVVLRIFCDFSGGGGSGPLAPSLDPGMRDRKQGQHRKQIQRNCLLISTSAL